MNLTENKSALMKSMLGPVRGVVAALTICFCAGCGAEAPKPDQRVPPPASGFPKTSSSDDFDAAPNQDSGPVADAKQRVRSFEQKRARIEPLLEKALVERDELVAKLRDAGVNSPADLKGNLRGQQLAASVQRISAEIEGLERQIATLDAALLDAKAVIRRMDREQAGISEEEMRKLAEQLKDAEERTDGTPLPVTPLDVDAALEKAFKVSRTDATNRPASRQSLVAQLVGKWEVNQGRKRGTVEFTKGGTALLVWSDGLRNALGESERRATLKYKLVGTSLNLEEPGDSECRQKQTVKIEVISSDELIFVVENRAMSFDWLEGRVKRVK
jgi:hypothetical protein